MENKSTSGIFYPKMIFNRSYVDNIVHGGGIYTGKSEPDFNAIKEEISKYFVKPPKFCEGVKYWLWAYWEELLGQEFIDEAYKRIEIAEDGVSHVSCAKPITALFFFPRWEVARFNKKL